LCVVYGCGSGQLVLELARQSGLTLLVLDEDPAWIAAVRERLYETGLYGVRFTAIQVPSLARTPLNDCTANLIVSERLLSGPSNQNAATDILRTSGRRAGTEVFSVPGAKRVVASGCAGAVRQTPSISSVTKHWNIR